MGRLVETPVGTLFEGVSRQPDTVRLPGQVEESLNALHTVVTGGFEKRPSTKHVAALTEIDSADDIICHFYDRDTSEQYVIMAKDEELFVRHLDGTSKTVTILDGVRLIGEDIEATETGPTIQLFYPTGETQIDLVYTGWGTGTVIIETSPTGAWSGEETTRATLTANGSQTVTLDTYIRYRCTAYTSGSFRITGAFQDVGYLNVTDPENFSLVTVADTTFIANSEQITRMINAGSATIYGPVKAYADLPRGGETVPAYLSGYAAGATWATTDTGCATGNIWKVEGEEGDPKGYYFVALDRTGTNWTWEEAADPNFANALDPAFMPHQLVRQADGSFKFGPCTWAARLVGDPTVVPDPDFVGFGVADITFFKDRLALVSDEFIYCSQPGDYFNMFPDSASQVKDSDPFGRVASGEEVNKLAHAIPFNSALWLTSEHRQFQLFSTSGALTARTADIDPSTKYDASIVCDPAPLGDELYFAAEDNNAAVIYEYFVDDDTITNTASDVTRHVGDYIPANVVSMSAFTPKGLLFALSDALLNGLFVYSVYWDGNEKAQSSWYKWTFGADTTAAYIHGHGVVNGELYLVIKRGTSTFLEKITLEDEFSITTEEFPARMDRKVFVGGTYDGGNDWTTWTIPYAHGDNLVGVTTPNFSTPGAQLSLTYPTSTTVRVSGDYSAYDVVFGVPYTLAVTLSKQYVRDPNTKRSFTRGRLQLHNIAWDYDNTGYFEVAVTPLQRATDTYKFNGRIIGGSGNIIGGQPLDSGTYIHRVGSNAATVTITLQSDKVVPVTITALTWLGTYNEVSKQEGSL